MSVAGSIHLHVDGQAVEVPAGSNVAAAIARVAPHFRRSCTGQPRAPLCGMGVCFECRVAIDGVDLLRACVTPARDGMQVHTDA
ncbi:(2Fe-2S)-binding protein [Pseudoxanthomonas wuyuanensis]